jgi:VanZ family protein
MIVIFHFSNTPNLKVSDITTWYNQPSYEQNVSKITFLIDKDSLFYDSYKDTKHLEFVLHKIGHIFFYSLLTFLFFINIYIKRFRYIVTLLFTFFYAFSDEVHQFFVVGRSGRILDVLLDTVAGVLTLLILYIHSKKRKKPIR